MNKLKFAVAAGLIASCSALGQDGPPPQAPGGMGMGGGRFGGPGMAGPGIGGPGMGFGGKVVTGAPYSADVASQSLQTLPDGNTISRNTTGHVARDSQGRTYTQETITGGFVGANGPVTVTFINDPVAGYSYVLNSTSKIATRMQKRTPPAGGVDGRARGNRPDYGPMGGRPEGMTAPQTSDLGTQNINGVAAQGKSMTHTVPAGMMGNTQPIVSSGETWFSPDLQVVVLAKHTDPRMGQTTYSLQNIQRAEPAVTLFQVPSDYTVQDGKAGPWGNGGPGGHRPPQQ